MADTGKTAEQYKMTLRSAGDLTKMDPGGPELGSALKKIKRIQDVWAGAALPIKEVDKATGREPVRIKLPNPPSSLTKAKNSSALRAGVERAQTTSTAKTRAPQPLQDNSLIGKYNTKPLYSGRRFNKTRPVG